MISCVCAAAITLYFFLKNSPQALSIHLITHTKTLEVFFPNDPDFGIAVNPQGGENEHLRRSETLFKTNMEMCLAASDGT